MLNNLLGAVPQVLEVLGRVKPEELAQYAENLCRSQNIPIEQAINQARGLINLVGGEENAKKMLNRAGFKLQ